MSDFVYVNSFINRHASHKMQAFTIAFGNCGTNSSMKMACLEAVEELLVLVC